MKKQNWKSILKTMLCLTLVTGGLSGIAAKTAAEEPFVTGEFYVYDLYIDESGEVPLLDRVGLWGDETYHIDGLNLSDTESARLAARFADCQEGVKVTLKYRHSKNKNIPIEIAGVLVDGISYWGDLTEDGMVNALDLAAGKQYLYANGNLSETAKKNADIDGNGEVTAADLQQIENYLLHKTDEFNPASPVGCPRMGMDLEVKTVGSIEPEKGDAFTQSQMQFDLEVYQRAVAKTPAENVMVSPLSMAAALTMTANGADGATREEMFSILGGDMLPGDLNMTLSTYLKQLPQQKKCKVDVADSIWINDRVAQWVKPDFLQENISYYDAEIYQAPFNDDTVQDVNNWVYGNTHKMIKDMLKEPLEPDVVMMLINTIAFDAEWEETYLESIPDKFTAQDGSVQEAEMLHSTESIYYELDNAIGFRKDYAGGDYSFVALLPEEGLSVSEFVESLDSETLTEMLANPWKSQYVLATMPKFKSSYAVKMKEILEEMGMATAFTKKADFSGIIAPEDDHIWIGEVLHNTAIEVTEKGTKASAATIVMMTDEACPIVPDNVHIVRLDRPFVYMIVDNTTNLPMFLGTVNSVE